MKIGIMQPYLFPYIGYYQLINAVDKFVVYDNIQFTKKGWINRNRILVNGKAEYITWPLKKDADLLNVNERSLAASFKDDKLKLIRKITGAYSKAPQFSHIFPLLESVINYSEENLFPYILYSLQATCSYLDIKTQLVISSTLPVDHNLRSQDKVISICKALGASEYINAAGGIELYSKADFEQNDIQLNFIKSTDVEYTQFSDQFVPWLSIIDVLMFNPKEKVQQYVQSCYTIL